MTARIIPRAMPLPDAKGVIADMALALAAGVLFAALAYYCIELTRSDGRIASIWLPNAFAVAFLLRLRLRRPMSLVAAMWTGNVVANLLQGDSVAHALSLSAANMVEIVIATLLTRRLCGGDPQMDYTHDLGRFALAAGPGADRKCLP